jgi:hypothetical protein
MVIRLERRAFAMRVGPLLVRAWDARLHVTIGFALAPGFERDQEIRGKQLFRRREFASRESKKMAQAGFRRRADPVRAAL